MERITEQRLHVLSKHIEHHLVLGKCREKKFVFKKHYRRQPSVIAGHKLKEPFCHFRPMRSEKIIKQYKPSTNNQFLGKNKIVNSVQSCMTAINGEKSDFCST